MPQLTPYYFSNENNFTFFLIVLLIYTFSKFILPVSTCLISTRSSLFVI